MKTIALGELVNFTGGGTPSRDRQEYWGGSIPWVSCKDLNGSLSLRAAKETITERGLASSASNLIPPQSLLVATRMSLGKAVINEVPVAINQDLKAAICSPGLHVRYLLWFWLSQAGVISRMGSGATVKGVTLDQIKELRIPLPSLEEQKRIAAILDKADAIRRKRDQAIKLADEFLRSLFLDMFGDPVRNPKGWPIISLGNLSPELRYGTSVKCSDLPEPGKLPVLRIPNVIGGKVNYFGLKYAHLSDREVSTLMLKRGDILFVRTNGNPEFIGRCAVFDNDEPTLFASYLIRARIVGVGAVPDFLSRMFMMPSYRTLMLGQAQTTAGNYNVSASSLSNLPIILPPLPLQQRFTALGVSVQLIADRCRSILEDAENLSCSLTDRAFRGGL